MLRAITDLSLRSFEFLTWPHIEALKNLKEASLKATHGENQQIVGQDIEMQSKVKLTVNC